MRTDTETSITYSRISGEMSLKLSFENFVFWGQKNEELTCQRRKDKDKENVPGRENLCSQYKAAEVGAGSHWEEGPFGWKALSVEGTQLRRVWLGRRQRVQLNWCLMAVGEETLRQCAMKARTCEPSRFVPQACHLISSSFGFLISRKRWHLEASQNWFALLFFSSRV